MALLAQRGYIVPRQGLYGRNDSYCTGTTGH